MLKMTLMTMMPTLLFFSACGPAPEKKIAIPSLLPQATSEELVLERLVPDANQGLEHERISTLSGELSDAERENILEGHTVVADLALGQKSLSDGLYATFDFSGDSAEQLDYFAELCRDGSCRAYEGRSDREIQAECREGGEVVRKNGAVLCRHEGGAEIIKSQDQRYFAMARFGSEQSPTTSNSEFVELERLENGQFELPWAPIGPELK